MIRRIYHLCDQHEITDARTRDRVWKCQQSWDNLFESGQMIPCHFSKYPRNAKDVLGDSRPLPFLRDCLQFVMNQCKSDDIILWTNTDNFINRELPAYLQFHIAVYGSCSIFRTELRGAMPQHELPPSAMANMSKEQHVGRDGFAFKKSWLEDNWDEIPDAVLAASMWDCHMAMLIRLRCYGIETTTKNMFEKILPAEIPRGYLAHIAHTSAWSVNQNGSAANRHNGLLFKEWAAKNLPNLKITAEGNLA